MFMAPIVAGALISAGASAVSSMATNAANERMADKQWNREYEASNTAVQRRVADLKAAGLSPTLAAGDSASVPSVASASQDWTAVGDAVTNFMRAGYDHQQAQELAQMNIDAESNYRQSLADYMDAMARNQNAQADLVEHNKDIYLSQPFTSDSMIGQWLGNLFQLPKLQMPGATSPLNTPNPLGSPTPQNADTPANKELRLQITRYEQALQNYQNAKKAFEHYQANHSAAQTYQKYGYTGKYRGTKPTPQSFGIKKRWFTWGSYDTNPYPYELIKD